MNFKDIHIGQMIKALVAEKEIESLRIRNFLKCTSEQVQQIYLSKSIDVENLLKWSKLLEYDFFRIYSQHLILYAPPAASEKTKSKSKTLPKFRKNIYTKEVIDFILDQINTNKMTKNQVIERYKIPKTTLYKWLNKYKS